MDNQALAELIIKFQNGDESVFNEIYNATQSKVFVIAKGICKNDEDAKDIMQEAYIYFYQKAQDIKKPESFQSWINMVTANKAKNLLRKNNPMLFNNKETELYVTEAIEDEDETVDPELDYMNEELKEEVLAMLNNLNEEKRAVIVLFYFEKMKIKEIAETLEINENTVKSRLLQAKKDLLKETEELKKKNKSLYGISPISLILWALRRSTDAAWESFSEEGGSQKILKNIQKTTSNPTAVSAAAGKQASTKAASGLITKIAGASIAQKIIAGVVAASIVAGSAVGTKTIIEKNHKSDNPLFSVEYETDASDNKNPSHKTTVKVVEDELNLSPTLKTMPNQWSSVINLEESGQIGISTFYRFDESSGVLTIYGTGEMCKTDEKGFSYSYKNFNDNRIKEVVISDGITTVGQEAFLNCKSLKKVTLGKDLISIEESAFACSGLESINIPEPLVIYNYAFQYCTNLKEVQLPTKGCGMFDLVFNGCINLETVSMTPPSEPIQKIDTNVEWGNGIFQGCSKLTDVTLPPDTILIPTRAFNGCTNLESLTIYNNIWRIANNAFGHCKNLKTINYYGTQEDWNLIKIEEDNGHFLNADVIYH